MKILDEVKKALSKGRYVTLDIEWFDGDYRFSVAIEKQVPSTGCLSEADLEDIYFPVEKEEFLKILSTIEEVIE